MAKKDPLGRPAKQVFSRRGTSFLTLSSSYEEESKVKEEEQAAVAAAAALAEPIAAAQAFEPPPPPKTLKERLRPKAPLRDVWQEQVSSVRNAQDDFQGKVMDLGDLIALKTLDGIAFMLGYLHRGWRVIEPPLSRIGRQLQVIWAGEDALKKAEDAAKTPSRAPTIDFVALAEKNIFFTDNHKNPLYAMEQLRSEHGYQASAEVLKPLVMEKIYNAFREVAPKAAGLPVPDKGLYAGRPMDDVLYNIAEEDVALFFDYVLRFPVGYVGKAYRLTESFAGWAVSGTPDD